MTPIQPRLAESNLFLISAGGPAALSFNEFNPIFNRNGITFQNNGLAGENATYAGEGVLSGITRSQRSASAAFIFKRTAGEKTLIRDDNIGNAFLQLELSPETSIQAEYRYRDRTRGDLQQRFFSEDFFPGLTDEEERHTYRLGGRHSFSPNSILLASLMYSKSEPHQRDNAPPSPIPGLTFVDFSNPPIDAFSGEIQQLFRSPYFNITSGLGYFKVNGAVTTTLGIDFPPVVAIPVAKTDIGLHHVNGYAYGQLNIIKNLTLTAGFSFDSLGGDSGFIPGGNKNQYNPKFGAVWNPFPDTTIRAAAFRALKRTLITDQTLEPTQVAGFNQFFDDPNITDAWRYGSAIDQKITKNLFAGVEVSKRDLTIPQIVVGESTIELDGEESQLVRISSGLLIHGWL